MSNLTTSVDDDLIKRARVRAIQQGTSLGAKVREFLQQYAGESEDQLKRGAGVRSSTSPHFPAHCAMRSGCDMGGVSARGRQKTRPDPARLTPRAASAPCRQRLGQGRASGSPTNRPWPGHSTDFQ